MAVAHDASSLFSATWSTSTASFSWTHTPVGTPRGVVVFVFTAGSASDFISSVTYGGTAMTRVTGGAATDSAGEPGRCDLFFLGSGLGTGAKSIVVNRTNNATAMNAVAATVTAATDTAIHGTPVLLQGDGTLAEQAVNDGSLTGQNSMRYGALFTGLQTLPTVGSNSTSLHTQDRGSDGLVFCRETTAGTGSRSVGWSNGTTDDRAGVFVAVRETTFPIVCTPSALNASGGDATLSRRYTLTADPSALSMAGGDATLSKSTSYTLTADATALSLTGGDAAVVRTLTLSAAPGDLALTGGDATLVKVFSLAAGPGDLAATGGDATLRVDRRITADPGAMLLAGGDALVLRTFRLAADPGVLDLSGGDASLSRICRLTADSGALASAGGDATLSYLRVYTLTADAGDLSLVGGSAVIAKAGIYTIEADPGVLVLAGGDAAVVKTYTLPAALGELALIGGDASISYTREYAITADAGALALSGGDATLRVDRVIAAGTGELSAGGGFASISKEGQGYAFSADPGALALAGGDAALSRAVAVAADPGALTLTGGAAGLSKTAASLIRELVIAAAVAAVDAVTSTVVHRSRTAAFAADQLPAIVISPLRDAPSESATSVEWMAWDLTLAVDVVVAADPPDQAADQMVQLAHAALMAEPNTLGVAGVTDIAPSGVEFMADPSGAVTGVTRSIYSIRYRTAAANLTVAP